MFGVTVSGAITPIVGRVWRPGCLQQVAETSPLADGEADDSLGVPGPVLSYLLLLQHPKVSLYSFDKATSWGSSVQAHSGDFSSSRPTNWLMTWVTCPSVRPGKDTLNELTGQAQVLPCGPEVRSALLTHPEDRHETEESPE